MRDFNKLVKALEQTHSFLQARVAGAINMGLTTRNWLFGFYIVEFELHGEDRAKYGESLMDELTAKLNHVKGIDRRSLFRFRQFYKIYPHLGYTDNIRRILDDMINEKLLSLKVGSMFPLLSNDKKMGTVPPFSESYTIVPGELIITRLSYSHIELLLNIENEIKRAFYEIECIKGIWSVRELKRQINSLCYERMGLSQKPELLLMQIQNKSRAQHPTDVIKNIYTFDFLELSKAEIVEESVLETALINNLQKFILELGNGFCFEARQKRILIGERYYFIDLVFYHRIIRCHVLIELKIGEFNHESIGQLNTYLNYYKEEDFGARRQSSDRYIISCRER